MDLEPQFGHIERNLVLTVFVFFCAMNSTAPVTSAIAGDRGSVDIRRPNIVLILADDLGFSDLGCYGGEIETPHLDRLAADGIRFSQFYNCALCGPSRAALMTGQYPHRVGVTAWTGLLNPRCVTLFELLKPSGYQTAAVGRLDMTTADSWHEAKNISRYVNRYLGSTGHSGPGHYFTAVRNNDFLQNGRPYIPATGEYKTDLITDFAVEFIATAARSDEPFFLYVAEYAPHWPLHAKPSDMATYRKRYREFGWDQARQNRHQRCQEMGLIPKTCELAAADPRTIPWSDSTQVDWEADRMAAYAGQVDSLDQSVGRIMSALKEAKIDENTLVIFLSDNGASDVAVRPELDKPGTSWRLDGLPTHVGNDYQNQPGSPETFMSAGAEWSQVSNAPFRGHKNGNFEGGISTPCLMRWPAVIQKAGTTADEPSHIVDIMATILEITGITYPDSFQDRSVQSLDGKSLLPTLCGKARTGHEYLAWATSGSRAIRKGRWKLVASPQSSWQLYDMATDRSEQHDLATSDPNRVTEMNQLFVDWLKH